jgi:hypothetical protein
MQNAVNPMPQSPKLVDLIHQTQYRIIPSHYPTINFFEDLVDPSEMDMLWEIESITNDRLRQQAGDIFLVSQEDRISGQGSSVVMAAFTHIGKPSRFTDGQYGIYYAGLTEDTAIRETVYRRELFFRATKEMACEIIMRVYKGAILKPLHDIRHSTFRHLHHANNYTLSQRFGKNVREKKSWGIIYNSVRHHGGHCIAALRPPAISIPTASSQLRYVWNGEKIIEVLRVSHLKI